MRRHQQRVLGLGISILGVLILSPALMGQGSPEAEKVDSLPTDWSHHHVIFSRPGTAEQAKRVEQSERYRQQQRRQSPARLREAAKLREVENGGALLPELQLDPRDGFPGRNKNQGLKGDWSQDIGPGATVGAMNYPAKFSFSATTANCGNAAQPDFVVYTTGLEGTRTQASIAAYDNIYSGCSGFGTVPTVYWAYNTGNGTVTTSPVFSRDGTQVAFVQTDSTTAGNGHLVLLRWAASSTDTVAAPTSLTRTSNPSYPGCTAPCMTTTVLSDASFNRQVDTNSSVFYDYDSDTAFVGDAGGWLHQFNPVFNGVPTEIRSAGWPVQVNPTTPTALTSPVYGDTSGKVFVADVGGFLYRVGPLTAAVATTSGPLDASFAEGGSGIVQGPVVDSTAEVVFVFAASDGSGGCPGEVDCTAVYELLVDFVADATGHEVVVGDSTLSGNPPSPLYIGAFNSTYLNSVNATGELYVCGNTGGDPVLYQVTIQAGILGAVVAGPVLSSSFAATPCSPVTDVLNPNASGGATEWMFASVQTDGVSSGCGSTSGCIFNFKDTPWLPSHGYTVGQEVLDSNFHIQVVSVAGTSAVAPPFWTTSPAGTTIDGGVTWLNQGTASAFTPLAWAPSQKYHKGNSILDPHGNIEVVTAAAAAGSTSGTVIPAFSTVPGSTITDGISTPKITWTNVGAIATAAITEDGGTSGIIWDNTVGTGTLAGASQIYFSTLSGGCGTGAADGCAVQASQAALH